MAVLVIIQEGAAGVPAPLPVARICSDPGLSGGFDELAVALVAPQSAIAPIGDEQVVVPIVVIVAYAAALAPTGAPNSRFDRDVGKCAVAVVLVQAADRSLRCLPVGLEARAVYQEDI